MRRKPISDKLLAECDVSRVARVKSGKHTHSTKLTAILLPNLSHFVDSDLNMPSYELQNGGPEDHVTHSQSISRGLSRYGDSNLSDLALSRATTGCERWRVTFLTAHQAFYRVSVLVAHKLTIDNSSINNLRMSSSDENDDTACTLQIAGCTAEKYSLGSLPPQQRGHKLRYPTFP